MTDSNRPLRVGYIAKMFPRLSETFILNEILELERRGVEVVIFSAKKPNEGRFHPQLSRLKARVFYLEDLDSKKWAGWISREWNRLSEYREDLWRLVSDMLAAGDTRQIDYIWWAAWVAAKARELGVSRLHAHFASLPSTIAYLTHRVSGIPFSFTAHAKDIFVYTPEETKLREKIEDADFMVTVTEFNKRYISEHLPDVDANKIKVVHNGIDLDRFQPDESVEREADLILGVGRLVPKKGFDDLLDACALLRKRGISFRCLIVGGGPQEAELHEKRIELGLEDEVTFAGPLHVEQVRTLMQKATVFCLPCTVATDNNVDALPTVLLESLAAGLPIVSTAISGVPEIVDSGQDGVLVEPGDPEALGQELAGLLASPERRIEIAHRGRAKAAEKFDQHNNVGQLLELFRSGGAERSSPRRPAVARGESNERRVLYVSTDKGIPFGGTKGAAIHIREFLDALEAEGFTPVAAVRKRHGVDRRPPRYPVCVFPADQSDEIDGMPTLNEAREFSLNQTLEKTLTKLLQDSGRFDFVYERYSLFGIAGREFARKTGVPYVLEVNSPLVAEASVYRDLKLNALAKATEKYLFSTADHIVTVSDEVRDHVIEVAPKARVTVVPNGVDVERFQPSDEAKRWREKFVGYAKSDFLVGFVGRVRPWHGVDVLIDAIARARATDPSLRLCVVGNARGMTELLEEQCCARGLDGAVTFTGEVSPETVPDVLAAMDAVVAPYPDMQTFYFSPLKIYEYMAAGKPIVASSIGQIASALENEVNALLVTPGDADELATALLRLRGDAVLRSRLGDAAAKEAAEKHTWRHRVRTVVDILEQLSDTRTVEAK